MNMENFELVCIFSCNALEKETPCHYKLKLKILKSITGYLMQIKSFAIQMEKSVKGVEPVEGTLIKDKIP